MVGLIFEYCALFIRRFPRLFTLLLTLALVLLIACSKAEDRDDGDLIEAIDQSFEHQEEADVCIGEIKNKRQKQLSRGIVEGVESNGVLSFLGIPYAKAPMAELRWKAPQEEKECFKDGIFYANQDAPLCPQLDDQGQLLGNEDCLSLNIWAPIHQKAKPLPVMVFIHGGGNQKGSAIVKHEGQRLYDGSKLVLEQAVILVVIQYRLGVLGWLNLDDNLMSGNYGLMDQISALKWIKNEIGAFGGNPNQITIFGESAGARNICALMVSPYAKHLFQSAILQSGSCYLPSEKMVVEASKAFLSQSPCQHQQEADLKCLSQLSLDQIFKAKKPIVNITGMSEQLQPYVDGKWITQEPFDAISEGKINIKALIVGSNQNETSIQLPEVDDEIALQKAVYAQYGDLSAKILALYGSQALSPQQKLEQITSDAKYICHARRIARAMSQGTTKVYLYSFGQHLSQSSKYREYGAYHGIELPFIFLRLNQKIATSEEIKTSQAITQYWGEFAKYQALHQHQITDLPKWPSYSSLEEQLIFDKTGIRLGKHYQKKECDFWDQYYDLF